MRALIILVFLSLATPALADGAAAARLWIVQLQAEGYTHIEESHTWLWRIRILAERGNVEREIILDRTTGEVLRDISRAEDGHLHHPYDDDDDEDDDDDD